MNDSKIPASGLDDSRMPTDELHKGLLNQAGSPGSANVSEEFLHRMEVMKNRIEENPKDTSIIKEYADLLYASHKAKESIVYYQKILAIDSERSDIYFQLVFVYYDLKDFDNAEKSAEKAVILDPQNHEAYYNWGAVNAARGNKDKAKKIWHDLLNKFPGSPSADLAEDSLSKL